LTERRRTVGVGGTPFASPQRDAHDADGTISDLDGAAWQERKQRLENLGGPPLP
jgi:hypothetical protein